MTIVARIFAIVLALTLAPTLAAAREANVAFTIDEPDLIPEGIAYDPLERAYYVSSTFRRKIVRVDASGKASDFTAPMQDGMLGALGMRVDAKRRLLFVAHSHIGEDMPIMSMEGLPKNASALAVYDLTTGKLQAAFQPPKPTELHFLNDVALAPDGTAYISDTAAGDIYVVKPGARTMELFAHLETGNPNGLDLSADGGTLIVAAYGPGVVKIDLKTKRQTVFKTLPGEEIGADGLYVVGNDVIVIQPRSKTRMIARYRMSADGTSLEKPEELLPAAHPLADQPTTGVIVGRDLFVIVNSQLQKFRKLYVDTRGAVPADALKGPIILRIPLDP
jgi:sugar lactone lactonase YvrE